MLLEKKNAVIYGAGGSIGSAVAQTFAREGARVFLAGRTLASLEPVARKIEATGGDVETAVVDALDEQAVEKDAEAAVRSAGGIDISINAIRVVAQGAMGSPLIEMSPENFARPLTDYALANFLTARAAARRMIEKRSG